MVFEVAALSLYERTAKTFGNARGHEGEGLVDASLQLLGIDVAVQLVYVGNLGGLWPWCLQRRGASKQRALPEYLKISELSKNKTQAEDPERSGELSK